jgi:hypothetical protein
MVFLRVRKSFLKAFKRPSKAFKRLVNGLSKAFQRPFETPLKGLLKASHQSY